MCACIYNTNGYTYMCLRIIQNLMCIMSVYTLVALCHVSILFYGWDYPKLSRTVHMLRAYWLYLPMYCTYKQILNIINPNNIPILVYNIYNNMIHVNISILIFSHLSSRDFLWRKWYNQNQWYVVPMYPVFPMGIKRSGDSSRRYDRDDLILLRVLSSIPFTLFAFFVFNELWVFRVMKEGIEGDLFICMGTYFLGPTPLHGLVLGVKS